MLKFLFGFFVGYEVAENNASDTAPRQSGASGWLAAFLIVIGILAWGGVKIGPTPQPEHAGNHAAFVR
jgi:hypothetical protein